MKFLFDLFPVILFFAAYKFFDIYTATWIAIAATFTQVGWVYWRHRKVDKMLWASLAVIVVFGGATLILRDVTFIKWKFTVMYWLFACALIISSSVFKKNPIKAMMGKEINLPEPVWRKLNASWAVFFALMGGLNLYVAFNFSTDTWMNFKMFGATGLMFLFVLLQGLMLAKYIEDKEAK